MLTFSLWRAKMRWWQLSLHVVTPPFMHVRFLFPPSHTTQFLWPPKYVGKIRRCPCQRLNRDKYCYVWWVALHIIERTNRVLWGGICAGVRHQPYKKQNTMPPGIAGQRKHKCTWNMSFLPGTTPTPQMRPKCPHSRCPSKTTMVTGKVRAAGRSLSCPAYV